MRVVLAGARRGKLSRKLKPLKAGRAVRVGVTLRRASSRGPRSGSLTVRVTRKGRTVARGRLSFGATAPSAPPPDPNSLAGRYFWGSEYTINGIEQKTLYFTGPALVYTAAAESAWPSCAAPSDTCKPYSYDAATRQLTIDGQAATLEGRKLTLDGQAYFELGFPPAGTHWDTRITYANSSGICPLYCNYYTENLTLMPDGLYLNDDGSLKAPGEGVILGGDGYFDIRD